MKNGLYCVQFNTQLGVVGGVAVLQDGKIQGGDSAIAYVGDYVERGDTLEATVNTNRHTPGMPSVFGRDNVTIVVKGRIVGDSAVLVGTSPAAPGIEFEAFLDLIDAAKH